MNLLLSSVSAPEVIKTATDAIAILRDWFMILALASTVLIAARRQSSTLYIYACACTSIVMSILHGVFMTSFSQFSSGVIGGPTSVESISLAVLSVFICLWMSRLDKAEGCELPQTSDGRTSPHKLRRVLTWMLLAVLIVQAWLHSAFEAWTASPVGTTFSTTSMSHEMHSWWSVLFSAFTLKKVVHLVGVVAIASSAIEILRLVRASRKDQALSSLLPAMKRICLTGLCGIVIVAASGYWMFGNIAQSQPMKMAVMQLDCLPLSVTGSHNGKAPTVDAVLYGGYWQPDGKVAMSTDEKMKQGKEAILALKAFGLMKKQESTSGLNADEQHRKTTMGRIVADKMHHFGYGSLETKEQSLANATWLYPAIRFLFIASILIAAFFVMLLIQSTRKTLCAPLLQRGIVVFMIFAGISILAGVCIGGTNGTPWLVEGMMPFWTCIGDASTGTSILTAIVVALIGLFIVFRATKRRS